MRKRISKVLKGFGWQLRTYTYLIQGGTVGDAQLFWEMLSLPLEHITTYLLACYITAKTLEVAEKENIPLSQAKLEEIVVEFVHFLSQE